MSKAVIPVACFGIDGHPVPSHLTFVVNPDSVLSPQTNHPWIVEMDHKMSDLSIYSLIPQKENTNQYVHHYTVERSNPRLIGSFVFTDAWMTTRHFVREFGDVEIHYSENLYNPLKAGNKLYFDQQPHPRIEITAPRFVDDREILEIVAAVAPGGCHIENLLQRRS